ncbi:MAG: polysaccharide deacetylase family protein [bacterium]
MILLLMNDNALSAGSRGNSGKMECKWCKKSINASSANEFNSIMFCSLECIHDYKESQNRRNVKPDMRNDDVRLKPNPTVRKGRTEAELEGEYKQKGFRQNKTGVLIADKIISTEFFYLVGYVVLIVVFIIVSRLFILNLNHLKEQNILLVKSVNSLNKEISGLKKTIAPFFRQIIKTVQIVSPDNNFTTSEKAITVMGNAPPGAKLILVVNDRQAGKLNTLKRDFSFEDVPLKMGLNLIVLRSWFGEDKLHTLSMNVTRTKPGKEEKSEENRKLASGQDSFIDDAELSKSSQIGKSYKKEPLPEKEGVFGTVKEMGDLKIDYKVYKETRLLKRYTLDYGKPSNGKIYTAALYDFTRGDTSRCRIALTFDADRVINGANNVLDTLASRNISCTFFLTGWFIKSYPNMVKRIISDNHEVGNHTYSHPHLTTYEHNQKQDILPGVTITLLNLELEKTRKVFADITGKNMQSIWRAPYGDHNEEIRKWSKTLGWQHVGWTQGSTWRTTMDSNDWVPDSSNKGYFTAEQIKDKILYFGQGRPGGANGTIVLMHLGTMRKTDQAYTRLGEIIDKMNARGFEFVTVGKMLGKG